MRESDSVAVYFVYPMIHALRTDPQRLQAILEEVGIDQALLQQPAARVPAQAFAALWLAQIRELDDEFFGLDSHGMPPGSFALICRALIQETNLEKALRQCLANFALFLRDFRGSLTVRGKRAVISLQTEARNDELARYGEETFLVLMISLLCWLGEQRSQTLPRTMFNGSATPAVGEKLRAQTEKGPLDVIVTALDDSQITVDGNNPLAGRLLRADVEVVGVRVATPDELQFGL